MSDNYGLNSSRATQLIHSAKEIRSDLYKRTLQAKCDRKIPFDTITQFEKAGFFKILQPEQWGGYAMDPQVFYAVQLELAQACMSSAWVLGVVGVHNWQLALFDNKAAEDVWGSDSSTRISSSYAPVGKVVRVDGGFQLTGRWGFSSGCEHCDWVFLGAVVPEEQAPFDMKNYRTFLLPRKDYEIIDTWNVIGLQGTGSHDIKVSDVFVPEYRTHKLVDGFHCDSPGNSINSAPLYRLPFGQVFVRSVCTASLGALQGCMNAYIDIAKKRLIGPEKMSNDVFSRDLVSQVSSAMSEMTMVMYRNFDEMMRDAKSGTVSDLARRVQYRYDSAIVADRCAQLSAKMLKGVGSKGIFLGNEVLNHHLDIVASQAHVANNVPLYSKNLGGMLFGEDNTDMNL